MWVARPSGRKRDHGAISPFDVGMHRYRVKKALNLFECRNARLVDPGGERIEHEPKAPLFPTIAAGTGRGAIMPREARATVRMVAGLI